MVRDDGANGCPAEMIEVRAGAHDLAAEVARHRVEAVELRVLRVDVIEHVVRAEAQGASTGVLQVDHDVETVPCKPGRLLAAEVRRAE